MDSALPTGLDDEMPAAVNGSAAVADAIEPAPAANGGAEAASGDYVPTYSELFPALGGGAAGSKAAPAWNTGAYTKSAVRSSTATEVFTVAQEEQRFKQQAQGLGKTSEAEIRQRNATICAEVMRSTGTQVDLSRSKDQSLSVVITGKREAVVKARKLLTTKLQTQASVEIPIPKEHHRFIIGAGGKRLKDLQEKTSTNINIPKSEDSSDLIRISGTAENCRRAADEIQLISDKQAKLDVVRMPILKAYHPLITGFDNTTLKRIMEATGVRIHVPPVAVAQDEIVVSGEKEGVQRAVAELQEIYDDKRRTCVELEAQVKKSQHRYVIGRGGANLMDIMKKTGVVVEVPPAASDSETIILRGAQQNLGPALTFVYEKANSMTTESVVVPNWVHRHIMGKRGVNIQAITADHPKVRVNFVSDTDNIEIEGPPEEVETVKEQIMSQANTLLSTTTYAEVEVDTEHHSHLIGRQGATIAKLKEETGVAINLPPPKSGEKKIRLEGSKEGIEAAKRIIADIVAKQKAQSSVDVIIPQRFHSQIIGAGGKGIREIISKCNGVSVNFPSPKQESDIITVRGDRTDVRKAEEILIKLGKTCEEEGYELKVPIFKEFARNIVGRQGATIRLIKEETNTRITVPSPGSDSNTVKIVGRREQCEDARDRILKIQEELSNIVSEELEIQSKYHPAIIGPKGQVVSSIQSECGVHIHLPSAKAKGPEANKVKIRGALEDVAKAKERVLALANETALNSHSEELAVPVDKHRFIIGRQGAWKAKLQQETGARVIIPQRSDAAPGSVTLVGTKEAVAAAAEKIRARLAELENIGEDTVTVDPKWFKELTTRRGRTNPTNFLRDIQDDFGVNVELPRPTADGEQSDQVKLKGAKEELPKAAARLAEIVDDLAARVTVECFIEQRHVPGVMGPRGINVQQIESDFNVSIKVPPRVPRAAAAAAAAATAAAAAAEPEEGAEGAEAAEAADEPADPPTERKGEPIKVTGRPENCEKACQALKDLVPTTETIHIDPAVHRHIIGNKGESIRKLMAIHDVFLKFPDSASGSDEVTVRGKKEGIASLKEDLASRADEFEEIKKKNFRLEIEVDRMHHRQIIGQKGATVNKLRADHDVQIDLPRGNSDKPDTIAITGLQEKAEAAAEAIQAMVEEWDSYVDEIIDVDPRVHRRIIGARGAGIRALQDEFQVQIKFPDEKSSSEIHVIGTPEAVDSACDELLVLEDEYMQDVLDREEDTQYLRPPSKEQSKPKASPQKLSMREAPWDLGQTEQFPTLGGGAGAAGGSSSGSVWGRGKPAV